MADVFAIRGRRAIVTGASSGLGARFAQVLVAAGAQVFAAGRRADRLRALAGEVGERLTPVPSDVTVAGDREHLVAAAVRAGDVDILVNAAGISIGESAEGDTLADWQKSVEVNLTATFALSQLVGRVMLEQGQGSIVNIASIFGLVGGVSDVAYAASKGAVVNLTRELAVQWAGRGVRVNAIAPGFFPSELTAAVFGSEAGRERIRTNTPMGRPGEPHELDGVLLFLASDASSYVTGVTVPVDGGWTAR